MERPMLKKYPLNFCQKWTDDEEITLLEELDKNMGIITIAEIHGRTTGGINSRRRLIAYKMYLEGIDIEKIIQSTKLDKLSVVAQISENLSSMETKKTLETQSSNNQYSEIIELKNEIISLKKDIKELFRLINQV